MFFASPFPLATLLVALLTALGVLKVRSQDIAITGRFGYATYDSFSGGGFLVRNYTESDALIGFTNAAGTLVSDAPDIGTMVPPTELTAMSGVWAISLTNGNSSLTPVPAGGTALIRWHPKFKIESAGSVGAKTLTWRIRCKVDGIVEVKECAPVPVQFNINPSSFSAAGFGNGLTGVGHSIYSGSVYQGTTNSTTINWGTINIGSPYPPLGKITVNGLYGNFKAAIIVDGVEVATMDRNTDDLVTVAPELAWETELPAGFLGKTAKLVVNNTLLKEEVIEADDPGENDNFLIEWLNVGGEWVFPMRQFDPNGNFQLPDPKSEIDKIELGPDPAHDGRPPGPIPGVDPAGDNTVDSDGAGAGVGLSVMDHYRATRQAMEDALGSGDGVGKFNYDEWRGDDRADLDGGAKGAMGSLGNGLGVLSGLAGGMSSMPVPGLTGADGFAVVIAGQELFLPVPSFAGYIRGLLALFLAIIVCQRAVATVRGAFSGK
jgi:hypothetical protein